MIAALLALAAAGCFTDPINRPPEITVPEASATPLRKHSTTYTVQATDPDGDPTSVVWDWVPGACTPNTGPASWPLSKASIEVMGDQSNVLMLDGSQTDASFCLWAFAVDSHGAITAVQLAVDPEDQAPTANIRVVAPNPSPNSTLYPLYSTIELSPHDSIDPEGDELKFTWTLQAPPGSTATKMDCNNGDECFTADIAGDYQITLVAIDPSNKTGTVTSKISVNTDQPPCIQNTMPSFQVQTSIPSVPSITVGTVLDDGDPFPSPAPVSMLHFRWSLSRDGDPFVPVGADFNFLPLDSNQTPGSIVKVRLEVLDRNPATATALFGCKDEDFCAATSGCFQRVSWSISYP